MLHTTPDRHLLHRVAPQERQKGDLRMAKKGKDKNKKKDKKGKKGKKGKKK